MGWVGREGAVQIMDVQEKKLRQSIWIIIGVGIFLTIALAVGLVTQVVNKQRAQIAVARADYATQKTQADALPKALLDKQKAEDTREYVNGQLLFFRQRYRSLRFDALDPAQITIPNLPDAQKQALIVANRNVVWRRWMNEYSSAYGPALIAELRDAAHTTGVILKTTVKVGDPPKAPEECVPPPNGLFRPTGGPLQISVTGALSNIMQFFNRINQASILMLVNNDIKMTGYSPDITATFSITPYLLASGDGAPITGGAAASSGASSGGSGSPSSASPSGSPGPSGSSGSAAPAGSPPAGSSSSEGGGGLRHRDAPAD